MSRFNITIFRLAPLLLLAALTPCCAVVETGASVVKAGASVASATVGVAGTVVGTTVAAGSAAVSAASAAKSVTVATVGTAVAGVSTAVAGVSTAVAVGSLALNGVQMAANASRESRADDVASTPVVASAPDRFTGSDGRRWITRQCAHVASGQPGLWVALRSGETVVRIGSGEPCPVLAME
jgi:hypothetical protein